MARIENHSESDLVARLLASLAVSIGGGAAALVKMPAPRVLALVGIGLGAYAVWLFLHVWLRSVLAGDADRRVAEMRQPGQLLRDRTDRSASSTTLRQGDDADRRSWRSILTTSRRVLRRLVSRRRMVGP